MASLYLRNNIYWITYLTNGKKISFSLKTKSKKEAVYKKNRIENELTEGKSPIATRASVRTALLQYEKHCLIHNKKHTVDNYMIYLNDFVDKACPPSLAGINERRINEYINGRIGKISKRTANHIITYIKQFLNFCVRNNLIYTNPIQNVRHFKIDVEPPRFLNKDEVKAVLEASAGETLEPMIHTAIYTGMRLGELKTMKNEHISFNLHVITIPRAKSGKFRVIPIHDDLIRILRKNPPPFDCANIRRVFKRICKRAGVSGIGWHTFRHTFASHLIMNGADLVTVSKLLGHADIKTTMIYSHLTADHVKDGVARLDF